MKIGVLVIGQIDAEIGERVRERLSSDFEGFQAEVISEPMPVPEDAFNATRRQYDADVILRHIDDFAERAVGFDRVLGIVDADVFSSGLNFVFGVAEHPGKAALVSPWRLRPEFYGQSSKRELFFERCAKEAFHELGHTLGLDHCSNPFCVMHFSNTIVETDVKKSLFCGQCSVKVEMAIDKMRANFEREV